MRLENLKKPFLSLEQSERIRLVEEIQEDRLTDKRGAREAKKLVAEFKGLSEEEKIHALSSTD